MASAERYLRVSTGERFNSLEELIASDNRLLSRYRAARILDNKLPKVLENFFQLLKEFERYVQDGVEKIMISTGVDDDSDLTRTLDVGYANGIFQLLANDYFQYVSTGRRPKARKVPISDLIQWIKEKRISYRGSINSAAFAIQQSIYKSGITGKNYQEAVIDFMTNAISEFMSLYLQDTTILNLIYGFYNFNNNEMIRIGVQYEGVSKTF